MCLTHPAGWFCLHRFLNSPFLQRRIESPGISVLPRRNVGSPRAHTEHEPHFLCPHSGGFQYSLDHHGGCPCLGLQLCVSPCVRTALLSGEAIQSCLPACWSCLLSHSSILSPAFLWLLLRPHIFEKRGVTHCFHNSRLEGTLSSQLTELSLLLWCSASTRWPLSLSYCSLGDTFPGIFWASLASLLVEGHNHGSMASSGRLTSFLHPCPQDDQSCHL